LNKNDELQETIEFCREADKKIRGYWNRIDDIRKKLLKYWRIK